MGFTESFILQSAVENTENVWREGNRYICKQNPSWTKFLFTVFISFTPQKTSQVKYLSNGKRFPCLHSKPEAKSRVCITDENSPSASSIYVRLCKHRRKVFYCFYKITFPRKKRKTLCVALIKREILTSRKILSTKSCTRNQLLFCKKMLCKIRIFVA